VCDAPAAHGHPMLTQGRFWLAAVLLCVCALSAGAQSNVTERELKAAPGKEVRVGVYGEIKPDCTSGALPAIRLVTPPAHGIVNVKRGTLKATNVKQCLGTEVPVFIAFYRAARNFSGSDEFVLEVVRSGRKQLEHFRVNVSGAAGGGQSI
jgi:uncharacterized membrane protein